ncbi:tetratricopeptide repeat protein [Teredinibacter haidensis]|uniref:tetratricopeptide repeat protein n=1 Tax=Teredinibacter haidensis TaxID=2731755 RepID=UPI0009F8A2FE|nr:tetratricopeptide repeat protein [Teredinibacter haidensis]
MTYFFLKQCALRIMPLSFLSVLCLLTSTAFANDRSDPDLERLEKLDKEFQSLSARLLNDYSQENQTKISKKNSISRLRSRVNAAFSNNNPILALSLITTNIKLIRVHIDTPETQYFLAQTLSYNERHAAEALVSAAKLDGNLYTQSKFQYLLANYYFKKGDWAQAQKHLSAIEAENALTQEEADYATIIFGITLQKSRLHRKSITFYERIKDSSSYYSYAQLNIAVAYIRQGWWTDAQIAIDKALTNTQEKGISEEQKAINNRLYLVLGYSQLQHEFYRDARETFRNIDLESPHVNQALLGIGLCALHQGDYVGSLNAFNTLKKRGKSNKSYDIYIIEANLLVPFSHEQMGQNTTASALYTEAIAYYQSRIAQNDQAKEKIRTMSKNSTDIQDILALVSQQLKSKIPTNATDNLAMLSKFSSLIKNTALSNELKSLENTYSKVLASYGIALLAENEKLLQSYLSQAQFGVAKLYDSGQ